MIRVMIMDRKTLFWNNNAYKAILMGLFINQFVIISNDFCLVIKH
jgi:hypothetical protein